jgi:uncharacterized protein (DUF169 family)
MAQEELAQAAQSIYQELRLKSLPVAAAFLASEEELPEGCRRPKAALGARITVCQGVSLARFYGWSVGLTGKDVVCPPAAVAFGLRGAGDPREAVSKLFAESTWCRDLQSARSEVGQMRFAPRGAIKAIALAPVAKAPFPAEVAAFFGNPAQVMRLVQAWTFVSGGLLTSQFGGKVECADYLYAPVAENAPQVSLPGMGDRVFAMVQDEEMVFSLPAAELPRLREGLDQAGAQIGARYPVPPYLMFEPVFPKAHRRLAKESGMED